MASANPTAERVNNEESPAAHGAMPSADLVAAIEAHRGADAAWAALCEEEERLMRAFLASKPQGVVVPCFLGGGFSFELGADHCRDRIAEAYAVQRRAVRPLAKLNAEIAAGVAAMLDEKEAKNLELIDALCAEEEGRRERCGLSAAARRAKEALAIERGAFRALLMFRPATFAEAADRFAYLTSEGAPWADGVTNEEEFDVVVRSMTPVSASH